MKTNLRVLVSSNNTLVDISIFILRCSLGIIFFGVGAGKAFGWFGGIGMETTLHYFTGMEFSVSLTYLSVYAEFIGGILLLVGLFTRPAAFALIINMIVATVITLPKGFFSGGASYPFSLVFTLIVILLIGPRKFSLDFLLFGRKF